MIGPGGQRWWTTTEAVAQLAVKRHNLGDWVRRSKQAGHVAGAVPENCSGCRLGQFPHVDPPKRSGAIGLYLAEQLLEVEAYTAGSHRGAARDA